MKGTEPWRELCTFTTYLHPLRLIQTPHLWSVYAFVPGQIGMCVKNLACKWCHHLHTSTHIQNAPHAHLCAHVSTHSHTHTDRKLNGKMFRYICLQNCTSDLFSFLTVDYLKLQCKCSFYQIALFKLWKVEKKSQNIPRLWSNLIKQLKSICLYWRI